MFRRFLFNTSTTKNGRFVIFFSGSSSSLRNNATSSSSSSQIIQNELMNIFGTSPTSQQISKLPIRDLSGKLSDDAFDELGETSLKDWIGNNMNHELEIVNQNGLFWVQRRDLHNTKKQKNKDHRGEQPTEFVGTILDAPPPPPQDASLMMKSMSKKKNKNDNNYNEPISNSSNGKPVDLSSIPQPDLWVQTAASTGSTTSSNVNANDAFAMKDSSPIMTVEERAAASQKQKFENVQRDIARLCPNGRRVLFCLPNFVVPLCHETMDILEEQISKMVPETDQFFKNSAASNSSSTSNNKNNGDSNRISPLKRFQLIFGEEGKDRDSFFSSNKFPGLDEIGAELVKLESFAPTKQQIEKWIEEEKAKHNGDASKISRVDNLIPESISLRGGAGIKEEPQSPSSGTDEKDLRKEVVVTHTAFAPEFELPNWIVEHDENGDCITSETESSNGNKDESNNAVTSYRYFFRLSPIFHEDKESAAEKLFIVSQTNNRAPVSKEDIFSSPPPSLENEEELVNPYFDDSIFSSSPSSSASSFQVFEYDAFRLARCLPPSGSSISLKSLTIGGVLNILSVPDVQFIITAFPEMFEYPVKFDESNNDSNNNASSSISKSERQQAVRFILAGVYDKGTPRNPDEVRADIQTLGDIRRNKADPTTGEKLSGGKWMRLFNKTNKLNKELALAMNPGPHPLKDPRVLSQLLFDMLPLDEPVELATLHRRLKTTAVQLGDNLDVSYFRKFPHMFKVIELGNAEKFGIVRADATVDEFLMNPKPCNEEQMWMDLFAIYKKLIKNGRQTIAFSLTISKVPTSARLKMEELVLECVKKKGDKVLLEERKTFLAKKFGNLGPVFLEEIGEKIGVFEIVSRQNNETFVRIRAENPIVQKYF